jgi:hypothetical protein
MPYITTEQVAAKRAELKKAFPEYKMSITRVHGSTISVHIMEGPIALLNKDGNTYVNEFYVDQHFEGESHRVISGIVNICRQSQRVLVEDGDYGTVPTFYVSVEIGKWDKAYSIKANN